MNVDHFLTLFDLIGVLARRRYQTAERSFSPLGLNHTEARLLRLLGQAGGEATQDALSSQLYVDRSNAGRALKGLEQGGYVVRRKEGADKRSNLVAITAKGREAVGEIAKLRHEIAHRFFDTLTADEAATIVHLLEKVVTHEAYP
jgi:DNA-binding MarR family transcriptional regulator